MIHSKSYEIKGTPLEVKKVYPFRVGFMNDIHVGSQFALCPENGWVTHYGSTIMPNEGQKDYDGIFKQIC